MGIFRSKKDRQPLARSGAEWTAGVFYDAPECTGIVTAYPEGLQARTEQDGNAMIEWRDFDHFGFGDDAHQVTLRAGKPWDWFFAINCDNAEDRAHWRELLLDKGVPERT